ncbi:MAG: lipocalin family protein [Patescibacteria group bacterium]|jgi:predicted secreted hydrolase
MKKITFPKDELVHNTFLEWWYWNGQLWDEQGRHYSYMNCLFRIKPKKVQLPLFKRVPFENMYFSHSLLSDITRKKFTTQIDYLDLVAKDSFSKPNLFVNYASPITKTGYFNKVMEFKDDHYFLKNENIELNLGLVKKPLLENGNGFVKLSTKKSYYYSLTNLSTQGVIKINNQLIQVKGKSWMDHQWANVKFTRDKWDWFSIQLENNSELVCYQYGKGKNKSTLATIIHPNSKQESTKIAFIKPCGKSWHSSKTHADYPLEWQIEIPKFKLKIQARALNNNQEVIFGVLNYWEGPMEIKAQIADRSVTGWGFTELVGYDSVFNDRTMLKNNLKDRLVNRYKKFFTF